MALSMWARLRVRSAYKYSRLSATSGVSGAETVATILRREGIYDVEILEHDQVLEITMTRSIRGSCCPMTIFTGTSSAKSNPALAGHCIAVAASRRAESVGGWSNNFGKSSTDLRASRPC